MIKLAGLQKRLVYHVSSSVSLLYFLDSYNKLLMLLFPFTIFRIATVLIFNTAVIFDIDVLARNVFLQSC